MTDCTVCHHDARSHNDGTCHVAHMSSLARGEEDYSDRPGGVCGCTAMAFDMVCPTCGKPFVCAQGHSVHDCLACSEAKKDDADMASFAPLVAALREAGIPNVPDLPWNTGGNVMCLGIEVPTRHDGPRPYIMFSDDAEMIGFGLYIDSDHNGIGLDPSWVEEYDDGRYDKGWATEGLAQRVAAWTASVWPTITDWVNGLSYTTGTWTGFGSTHDQYWATYEALPTFTDGTTVEDFNDGPCEPAEDAVPLVTDILPGTPEWDASEAALAIQRAHGG